MKNRIFVAENATELVAGDKIVYHKVGAYTMCLAPLFIEWFPVVYLNESGQTRVIRNKWTVDDYMSGYKEETV